MGSVLIIVSDEQFERERERQNEQKKKKIPTGRIGWSPTRIKMGVGCWDPSNLKRKCWENEKENTKRCCGLLLL